MFRSSFLFVVIDLHPYQIPSFGSSSPVLTTSINFSEDRLRWVRLRIVSFLSAVFTVFVPDRFSKVTWNLHELILRDLAFPLSIPTFAWGGSCSGGSVYLRQVQVFAPYSAIRKAFARHWNFGEARLWRQLQTNMTRQSYAGKLYTSRLILQSRSVLRCSPHTLVC